MRDHSQTIDDLWTAIVKTLLEEGHVTESRVGKVTEVLGYSATLTSVNQTFLLNKRRKLSPAYACAEVLWYLSLSNNIDMIKAYAPQYEKFAEDGIAHGAYGYRMAHNAKENQLELLIEHLQSSSSSRQAVITFWNANDLWHSVRAKRKDLPCTLSLQFLIRHDKLHLITTMRSNDVWLGLPYDIFAFTCFQWLVASILGVEPGTYSHQAGSMHLYEKNWPAAKEAIEQPELICQLEHGWNLDIPLWKYDIRRATMCEQKLRKKQVCEVFPVNDMLHDVVACCATKWGWEFDLKSPVLKEALENETR